MQPLSGTADAWALKAKQKDCTVKHDKHYHAANGSLGGAGVVRGAVWRGYIARPWHAGRTQRRVCLARTAVCVVWRICAIQIVIWVVCCSWGTLRRICFLRCFNPTWWRCRNVLHKLTNASYLQSAETYAQDRLPMGAPNSWQTATRQGTPRHCQLHRRHHHCCQPAKREWQAHSSAAGDRSRQRSTHSHHLQSRDRSRMSACSGCSCRSRRILLYCCLLQMRMAMGSHPARSGSPAGKWC